MFHPNVPFGIIIYFNKNPSNLLRSIQKFLKNNFYKEIYHYIIK